MSAKIKNNAVDSGKVSPFSLMSVVTRSTAPKNYAGLLDTI